jgi:2-polyprenyl-3-methyl-5-hydroxy-6-metoxy-1,4-benzoquinol methylase
MSLCADLFGCNPENQELYAQDQELTYSKCLDCGIIWRDQRSYHLEKSYDKDYFDSKSYQKNRAHKIEKSGWLLDLALNIRPEISSMLEVGCSLGNTLEAAKLRGIDQLGIDVSKFAVDYCLQNGLNATTQSLNQLLLEERKYQLIFMQHVLEHFKNPFEVLRQCYQLLESQGMMMILIPNSKYRRSVKQREKHRFYSKDGVGLEHYVYFDYQNLARVLHALGFKVVQQNYPAGLIKNDSLKFFLNRIARRSLTTFHQDQELIIIAEKL